MLIMSVPPRSIYPWMIVLERPYVIHVQSQIQQIVM